MHVVNNVRSLLEEIIEQIGIKSGVALTETQFSKLVKEALSKTDPELTGIEEWWSFSPDKTVRLETFDLEMPFLLVMKEIGAVNDIRSPQEMIENHVRSSNPSGNRAQWYQDSLKLQNEIILENETPKGLEEFAAEVRRRYLLNWNFPEIREWDGIVALNNLFSSEKIPDETTKDQYFDQRFIDYLNTQVTEIPKMHWRQFEYLCGEYFKRQGYAIQITRPRADGGIDVIATRTGELLGPDLIFIQAKKYTGKNTVTIEEVKALWADLNEADATKALIATTTRLEKGARTYCEARKYRLSYAELETVRKWLSELSKNREKIA